MTTEPIVPLDPAAPEDAVLPRADCTADRAGGLTFDVLLPGPAGGARTEAEVAATGLSRTADAALLLVRRGSPAGGDAADTVRLPLTPVAPGGPLRAALPSTMTLPEGRWDAYLEPGGSTGDPLRLRQGVHDLRPLVGRTPRHGRTWFGVRIPYATEEGLLVVRAWLRWPHAEAGELFSGPDGLLLHGRLYGVELADDARLLARARRTGTAQPETVETGVPVTRDQDDSGAEGTGFGGALPYAGLAGRPVWDLLVAPGGTAEPVRIARILDDVPDKKLLFVHPPREVADEHGTFTVQPYYTRDNDLSVRIT